MIDNLSSIAKLFGLKQMAGKKSKSSKNTIKKTESFREITWTKDVSLVTNKIVMSEMLKLFGITGLVMALLMTLIFVGTDEIEAIPPMMLMTTLIVGGLYIVSLIVMVLFYGNKMLMRFTLDNNGIIMEVTSSKAKFGNRSLVALGLISGKIGAVGTGLTSISQEKQYVNFSDIDQVIFDKNSRVISLYNSWRRVGILFCNQDNYDAVKNSMHDIFNGILEKDNDGNLMRNISNNVNKKDGNGDLSKIETNNGILLKNRRNKRIWDYIFDTALVVIATIPMFMIEYPEQIDLFIIILLLCFAVATVWLIPLLGWVVLFFSVIAIISVIGQLFQIIPSFFVPSETYVAFELYNFEDWFILLLFLGGQAYLIYNSIKYISGKKISALLSN